MKGLAFSDVFPTSAWLWSGPGIYQPDFILNLLNGGHGKSTLSIKSTPQELGMCKARATRALLLPSPYWLLKARGNHPISRFHGNQPIK